MANIASKYPVFVRDDIVAICASFQDEKAKPKKGDVVDTEIPGCDGVIRRFKFNPTVVDVDIKGNDGIMRRFKLNRLWQYIGSFNENGKRVKDPYDNDETA